MGKWVHLNDVLVKPNNKKTPFLSGHSLCCMDEYKLILCFGGSNQFGENVDGLWIIDPGSF